MKYNKKNIKGIALISLVITIIILIILSTLVINVALGENGLLNRVKYAKKGESILGYYYSSKNITAGDINYKIVKIQ